MPELLFEILSEETQRNARTSGSRLEATGHGWPERSRSGEQRTPT